MSTNAHLIAMKLSERVALISIANGYETNIGTKVFRGKLSLLPEQMPCTVMVEGEDVVMQSRYADVRIKQRYIFEGHMPLAPDQIDTPNDVAHLILKDLKRAIFGGDLTLEGLLKDKEQLVYVGRNIGVREDGQPLIAASIEIDVSYAENLANP